MSNGDLIQLIMLIIGILTLIEAIKSNHKDD